MKFCIGPSVHSKNFAQNVSVICAKYSVQEGRSKRLNMTHINYICKSSICKQSINYRKSGSCSATINERTPAKQ